MSVHYYNGPTRPTDSKDTLSRMRLCDKVLRELLLSATSCTKRSAYCMRCNSYCYTPEADVHVAGSPCTDFSIRGGRAELQGATTWGLMSFISMRRQIQEAYWIQENVQEFPVSLLSELLSDLYEIQSCIVDAGAIGWPITRKRQYVVGRHLHKTCSFHMQLVDFVAKFTRPCICDAGDATPPWDAFFVATDEELQSELEWAASRPSSQVHKDADGNAIVPRASNSLSFSMCLTRMEQRFREGYEKLCRNRCYSLAQNPDFSAYSSWSHMHTLLRNTGVMWSDYHSRWLTANEALLAQGFPVYTWLSFSVPMCSFAAVPTTTSFDECSRSARIGMAGNSMHNESVAIVLFYILTHGALPLDDLTRRGLEKTMCRRHNPSARLSPVLASMARVARGEGIAGQV